MNQKFTAEEVQHLRQRLKSGEYDGTVIMRAWIALEAYADSIERAQAGVTDEVVERATVAYARTASKHIPVSAVSMRAALLAVWPSVPAQAAQADKSEATHGHLVAWNAICGCLDRLSPGWITASPGSAFERAIKAIETLAKKPTAEPVAQPADSGRVELERWGLPDATRMAKRCEDGYWTPWHVAQAAVDALTAQGQGEATIVVGQTRCYGDDEWYREITAEGICFLAPLDQQDAARNLIGRGLAPRQPRPQASPAWVPDLVSEVMAELEKAIRKFPTWPADPLHAVGVLNEEVGELNKAVLQQVYEPHKNAADDVRKEARQAAAMALRFLVSIDSYDWTPGTQHEQPSLAATPLTIIQDSKVSAADFAAAMRSCGLSLKTFAEVDREARRVAKERAAAPSATEGDGSVS